MKRLIIALLVLAAVLLAMLIAPQLIGDKGYVLISMGNLVIEMSVVSLAITVFVAAIAWWVIRRLLRRFFGLFRGSHQWFGSRSERKRQRAFYRGLQALAEGQLEDARNALMATTDGDFDGINYLAAAQVARIQRKPERVRYLLQQAAEYSNSKVAATLSLARMELDAGQPENALGLLNGLGDSQQTHPQVVRLKAESLAAAGQWQQLHERLHEWKKPLKDDYVKWARQVAEGKFAEIASKEGANGLKQYWQDLPRKMRHDPAYQAAYVTQLLEQGMHNDAQDCLLEWQKKGPEPLLFPLFKALRLRDPSPTIRQLEKWIKQDDQNAELFSTLGHVALHSGDTALAEKALMRAVRLSENSEDLMALSHLRESQHDSVQALSLYKQGIELAQSR
ncbi:heme biosynthesis protein [Alteromonas aestuariivivens]|uniref:Heme biosynthesis protein n=1 Tax=Alteromonas aestuariivivens TaxID=1938339 RepID=A0A3D8M7E9_9ALTE|nr:heme biosynthesis HemY N-terminal domain-containing protein [Alteromonas aestuariivivens]RDV25477.1 heme biosynthesis protein [Alteromonas aestuariivivens]